MNKFLPEYLEDFNNGLKQVCEKLDLILEAIYGEEDNEDTTQDNNANNKPTAEKKKRGRQPKK